MLFFNENQTAMNHNFLMQLISENAIYNRFTREAEKYTSPDEKPRIVFFPSNQAASSNNVCQDEISSNRETGFNTFAFLSFTLTIFNAIRYIYNICDKINTEEAKTSRIFKYNYI